MPKRGQDQETKRSSNRSRWAVSGAAGVHSEKFLRFLQSNRPKEFAKDVIYRFLNNPLYDWRRFLLKLSAGIANNFLNPLTKPERVKALIVDDSLYSRNRSKKVELLARVFDHVTRRYAQGIPGPGLRRHGCPHHPGLCPLPIAQYRESRK